MADIKVTILGSGTGVPHPERSSPCIALFIEDKFILLDIGPGALGQAAKAGLAYQDIDIVCISHFHPDHAADLVHLMFATRYPPVLSKRRPFKIIGPEGLGEFIRRLKTPYNHWLDLPSDLMSIDELSTEQRDIKIFDRFRISSIPLNHTPNSIGFRIEDHSGKSVVYSGDTAHCEQMVELALDADLLILEASFPDGQEVPGHLTPSQAGRVATGSGARRLILTHFYPECLETDIESQCRKTYQGELSLARDLISVYLKD